MGLLPSAPKVEVFAPGTLFVGQRAVIQLELTAEDETKVEFIDVHAWGKQGWTIGYGDSAQGHRVVEPALVSRVMGAGVLAAGTTKLSASFVLPAGMAPTHALAPAWARFELRVHVSIPWWLDGRFDFEVPVRMSPPSGGVTRTPIVHSRGHLDEPRLELSLASTRLIVGETLVGSCAVFHLDDRKEREVELSLVPSLELRGRGRAHEQRGDAYVMTLYLPPGSAGTSTPFELVLPPTMVPSFDSASHALSWSLVARTGGFFRGKVEAVVPLEVVDASAATTTQRLTVTPRLADERIRELFEHHATAHGRRVRVPPADEGQGDELWLEWVHAGCMLRIAYAYRGKAGTFLGGRIGHPSLGLGLAVSPGSAIRHVLFRDIEVDLDAWDRAHHVGARSAAQAIPFLRAAVPAIMAALTPPSVLGTLVRWHDDQLVFERPVAVVVEADLVALDEALAILATEIERARPAIAPPPDVIVDEAAWRELASWLRGRLTLGELSITGRIDQLPVTLGLAWVEGRASHIRAQVGDPELARDVARRVVLAVARPAAAALDGGTPDALVELFVRWPADVVDLVIADGVATASWQLGGERADAARVRSLVEMLRAALVALDPGTGPYR